MEDYSKKHQPSAWLKYLDNDGDTLIDSEDIITLCTKIIGILDFEVQVKCTCNQQSWCGNRTKNRNQTQNNTSSDNKERTESVSFKKNMMVHTSGRIPRQLPQQEAYWGQWHTQHNWQQGQKQQSKMKSIKTKANCSTAQTTMVRFNDYDVESNNESATSSNFSCGKLMEIDIKSIDRHQQHILKLTNEMLPCPSTKCMFTIKLKIILQQCISYMNCGAIIWQKSMILLDLDAPVQDSITSCGDMQIRMIPCNYWTTKCIQQQQERLNRQPSKLEVSHLEEIMKKSMWPKYLIINYIKANLNEIVKNSKDLVAQQQLKVLSVVQ